MYVVDRNTMVSAEKLTENKGTSLYNLMLNAGNAAASFVIENGNIVGKRVCILCGKGNNGGDGFVMARRLSLYAEVSVVMVLGKPATELSKKAFAQMGSNIKVLNCDNFNFKNYDIIIDAVFGTGYNGEEPKGQLKELFKNQTDYALDIPSGLECDTGKGYETCLKTKCTLTFGAKKLCQVLPFSADACGKVVCLDIGITKDTFKKAGAKIKENKKPTFAPRPKTCHKNTFGTALTVTGSYGMSGAALLSSEAALKSGVGLLKAACIEENYTILASIVPEAVLIPLKSNGKTFRYKDIKALTEPLKTASALLIGCGLSLSNDTKNIVYTLLEETAVPTVLDADGINAVAERIELLKKVKAPVILTPHPAEMARLLGSDTKTVEQNRFMVAETFAKEYGVYLILKGANTIIASPSGEIAVNTNGNSGMAKAGSGDMLSGILIALLANGLEPFSAASAAVWLHAAAGDLAKERRGERAMLPSDMIEELCKLF